jgi:hypothetical protein
MDAPRRMDGDDAILAQDVEARKVTWLWRKRIPAGMLCIVAGRPDQGKGLFCAHVAAEISKRGGNVLYSAVEDDAGLMTRPRLEAAGANLSRILLWRFRVPVQFDELSARIVDNDIRLVVMDPFAAHLSKGVSRFSDSIRDVTSPMSKLAEQTGCTFLIVEHALKKVQKNAHPLAAIGGNSSGLPAASRVAFVFGRDPDDSDRRILATVKCNLREMPKALSFETDTDDIEIKPINGKPEVIEMPLLVVQGETEFDAKRLLGDSGEPGKVGRKPEKRAQAAEWLTKYLAAAGKPVRGAEVLEDAKQYGLTSKTVRRAADDMGVLKSGGGGRNVTWDLPADIKKALKG